MQWSCYGEISLLPACSSVPSVFKVIERKRDGTVRVFSCHLSGRTSERSFLKKSADCSVVSDSLQPHGLYSPWNSLGQNTGVGDLVAQSCLTLATPWTVACQAPLSMGFSRQEHWMDCHFLLQGIFPTLGLNPSLLHWQVDFLRLSHLGSSPKNYWRETNIT